MVSNVMAASWLLSVSMGSVVRGSDVGTLLRTVSSAAVVDSSLVVLSVEVSGLAVCWARVRAGLGIGIVASLSGLAFPTLNMKSCATVE